MKEYSTTHNSTTTTVVSGFSRVFIFFCWRNLCSAVGVGGRWRDFRFLIQNVYHRNKESTWNCVCFVQTQSLKVISNNQESSTVSYFMKSCGLSLESAISASKSIQIKSTQNPDSILELLRKHGFTETHIRTLFTKYPSLIIIKADETLKPKIEFFKSMGLSGTDLGKILCADISILKCSLSKRIIPTMSFLQTFIHTNQELVTAMKQCSHCVRSDVEKVMLPNISTLRALGVPESNISKLIVLQPRTVTLRVDLFQEVTRVVKEMGFDPQDRSFIMAVRSMGSMSKSNWEKKIKAYENFGWSEADTLLAIKKQPMCMLTSENKITKLMDFFVNKLGLKPSDVAKCPNLMLISMEKRIIPRCSVLQVLMSKGLIEKGFNVVWVLNSTKKDFEEKYVIKYEETLPEVVKAYLGEIEFVEFEKLSF